MKCKLTRMTSTHANLRTDEVIGECEAEPELLESFCMTAPPLDPTKTVRRVETTTVTRISYPSLVDYPEEDEGFMEFVTANSTYHWRSLE